MRAIALRPGTKVVVFGDSGVLERAAERAGVTLDRAAEIVEVTRLGADEITPGQPSDLSGRAQVEYLTAATEAALAGRTAALITAPISKEWAGRAGFRFPGHTEYLADRAGVSEVAMMIAGPRLRVTVVTTHLALREAIASLTINNIASAIRLTAQALRRDFALPLPKVAVAGLNPHAGESGRFGDEETRLVVPAMEQARRRLEAMGVTALITGPHVPDVVFRQAARGDFDAVVALYHDQGLIPVKLLHFEDAVNLTLGLPFVRTSPDHGTAYDIAGTGRAQPHSFLAALDLAARLTRKD